jgi:hypothetical protein
LSYSYSVDEFANLASLKTVLIIHGNIILIVELLQGILSI